MYPGRCTPVYTPCTYPAHAPLEAPFGVYKQQFWQRVLRWLGGVRERVKRVKNGRKRGEEESYPLYSPGVEGFMRFWSLFTPQGPGPPLMSREVIPGYSLFNRVL